jgi:hypothetical protein
VSSAYGMGSLAELSEHSSDGAKPLSIPQPATTYNGHRAERSACALVSDKSFFTPSGANLAWRRGTAVISPLALDVSSRAHTWTVGDFVLLRNASTRLAKRHPLR